MKTYTDLEQSKKLEEILSTKSADMVYLSYTNLKTNTVEYDYPSVNIDGIEELDVPCWSLAALLDEIPYTIINKEGEDLRLHIDPDNHRYSLFYENEYTGDMFEIETKLYDNMIDACYEMLIKLNEQNLLI